MMVGSILLSLDLKRELLISIAITFIIKIIGNLFFPTEFGVTFVTAIALLLGTIYSFIVIQRHSQIFDSNLIKKIILLFLSAIFTFIVLHLVKYNILLLEGTMSLIFIGVIYLLVITAVIF